MKRGLIAAALQRSRKGKPAVSDDLALTHEAIVEVMKEDANHG